MQWKNPKNTDKYHWTAHVAGKMRYYGLSEQKVLGVIRNPKRIETGIAENTVAVMVPVGNIKKNRKPSMWNRSYNDDGEQEKWNQEIWAMYQIKVQSSKSKVQSENTKIDELRKKLESDKKITIISAWRYPGVSPKNNPIPAEILREIEEISLK
jgi:predicted oxidoreductase